ncbi:MAG: LD-carboxypeptidase [Bacteroidales bacterium]|nr:LD-carboxypeptidase [Bacteroidales bacterium]
MKKFLQPAYLQKGDTVAVVALASALSEESRKTMYWKEMLESWGLRVKLGKHLYDSAPGEFAGLDDDRAADLEAMLRDPEVKAIISFRGGYGSMRTVRAMDPSLFTEYPKWLVGFSDITVFHTVLQSRGIESILGAMPSTIGPDAGPDAKISEESLRKALFGEIKSYRTAPHPFSHPGSARGRLVGGNLSLIVSCLGTPWQNPLTEDSILFIEDVDERMYNLDRMLLTLQQGGTFDRAKAVIIGQFTDTSGEAEWQRKALDLVHEYMAPLDKPVLFGFDCGHEHPNYSLYLGRAVSLDVTPDGGFLKFLD